MHGLSPITSSSDLGLPSVTDEVRKHSVLPSDKPSRHLCEGTAFLQAAWRADAGSSSKARRAYLTATQSSILFCCLCTGSHLSPRQVTLASKCHPTSPQSGYFVASGFFARSPTCIRLLLSPTYGEQSSFVHHFLYNAQLNFSVDKSEFECTNDDIRGTKFRVKRLRRSVAKPRMSCRCHYGCMPNYYFVF